MKKRILSMMMAAVLLLSVTTPVNAAEIIEEETASDAIAVERDVIGTDESGGIEPDETERKREATEADTATVTFILNDGSGKSCAVTDSIGATIQSIISEQLSKAYKEKAGYRLAGWYDAAENGNRINIEADTTIESLGDTKAFYAYWVKTWQITFRLGYEVDGEIPNLDRSFIPDDGDSYTDDALKETDRTGYTFIGWYDESGVAVNTTIKIYDNHTLTAQWKANEYTITLDANGGSCSTQIKNVTYDKLYGTLDKPTRTGYEFQGWFYENGDEITADTVVDITNDSTLKAKWTANTYTLTFNANGGNCATRMKTVTYDRTYGSLPTPTRTGYTFTGWYLSEMVSVNADTKVSTLANQTVYAYWKKNEDPVVKPSQPTLSVGAARNLKISGNSTTSAKVSWSAASKKGNGRVTYKVYYSTDKKKFTLKSTTTSLSCSLTKLKKGTTCYVKVESWVGSKKYASTGTISYVNRPEKVKLTTKSKGTVLTLYWGKLDSGIAGLELQKKVGGKYKKLANASGNKFKSFGLLKKDAKKVSEFRIRVYYKVGGKKIYSDWSSKKYTK